MKKRATKKRQSTHGKPVTKVIQISKFRPRSRPRLSRGRKDRVTWQNSDDVRVRIKFSTWPFTGKRRIFPVAAGKQSIVLTVRELAEKKKYRYAILTPKGAKRPKPPAKTPKGPPDPPGVSVGG